MAAHPRLRRASRIAILGVSALLGLAAVVIVLLLLPPVRERILAESIDRSRERLPGTVSYDAARWPTPGSLVFENLLWVDGADTLLTVRRLSLSVRVPALRRRDLHVERVRLEGLRADLPAIQNRFPKRDRVPPSSDAGRAAFPREGALPTVPSLAVDDLTLTDGSLLLPNGSWLTGVDATLSVDLLTGHPPRAEVTKLAGRNLDGGWDVEETALTIDLAAWRITGASAGWVAPDWPYRLRATSDADDQLHLDLDLGEIARATLALDLRLDRKETRLRAIEFDAAIALPSVEDLSRVPALSPKLAGAPPLEGLRAHAGGQVTLLPRVTAEASVRLEPNAWLESGRANLHMDQTGITVDTLDLALPDLRVAGRGTLLGDTVRAETDVTVSGARWLALLQPEAAPPESLAARLRVTLSGPMSAPLLRADLAGGARTGAFVLDRVEIGAETPRLGREPVVVTLLGRALDLELRAEAEVDTGRVVAMRLSPLVLRDAAAAPTAPRWGARSGRVRFDPAGRSLTVAGVEILGDAGRFRLDGEREGDGPARFALEARWTEPPRLLTRRLSLAPAATESLAAAFRREDPFTLTAHGNADLRGSPPRVTASGSFVLPGPRALAALLPAGARVDDLGPLRGVFEVRTASAGDAPAADLVVDLGETAWLDVALARLRMSGSDLAIDSLALALEGVAAEVTGSRADSLWDVDALVSVTDPRFVGRFLDAPADSLDLGLETRARLRGTISDPRLAATVTGHFSDGRLRVPVMTTQVEATPDSADAQVHLPDGLTIGGLTLDGVDATFRSEPGSTRLLPGRLLASAHNPDLSVVQDLRLEPGPGLNARVERFEFVYLGHDLRSQKPFRVSFGGADSVLAIDEFELSGDLGSITGAAVMGPNHVDLHADAEVQVPPRPTDRIPAGLWPQRVSLTLRAADQHDLTLEASADGLDFGRRENTTLQLRASTDAEGGRADLTLRDGLEDLFRVQGEFPLLLTLAPFSAGLRHDSVQVEARWNAFPLPLGPAGRDWNAKQPAVLNGTTSLTGTLARPDLSAELQVSFPDWPQLAAYRAEATLRLPPGTDTAPRGTRSYAAAGLTAALAVKKNEVTLIHGDAAVPLLLGVDTLSVRVDPELPVTLRLHSEELTLADFNPLLPGQTSMSGRLKLDLEATGPAGELNLTGRLQAPEVRVTTAEESRATASMDLKLGGTSKRPSVTGRVEIQSGIIQIPDPPKALYPTHGEAVLWAGGAGSAPAAADSLPASPPAPPPAPRPEPAVQADLDVRVIIPSALWIRGRGLDVELAGDLTLVQSGTLPTVTGELRAVRGRFVFLGRTFQVDRGGVVFYGDDEINPVLDLALSATVEATRINILVSGTALEPKLTLTSVPEMTEGDIMSVLLFGRSLGELDSDQMTLLESRAADVAASYAASELGTRLSRQLGVDMVTIERGGDTGREDALVIGKYLSPRALLKYEQALKSGAGFFVNLEYLLTRSLKIETLIGPQSQSGIEVNWTRDY